MVQADFLDLIRRQKKDRQVGCGWFDSTASMRTIGALVERNQELSNYRNFNGARSQAADSFQIIRSSETMSEVFLAVMVGKHCVRSAR